MLTSAVNPELTRLPLRYRDTKEKLDNLDKTVSDSFISFCSFQFQDLNLQS
jgi:hypothetical protein